MLTHLRIRDLIVVEEAVLALAPGYNVLSGSTGAGKSVLLAALGLVTGARARADWIRPGADRAVVEERLRIFDVLLEDDLGRARLRAHLEKALAVGGTYSRIFGDLATGYAVSALGG